MLSVELFDAVLVESRHLHAVDLKALLINSVNDLTHVHVAIRLDSSEGSLSLVFEMVSSVHITVVHDLKNSRHDSHVSALEEVVKVDLGNLLSLEEGSLVLAVEHLNGASCGEVEQSVISDYISLLVVPFDLEGKSLFTDKRHFKINIIDNGFNLNSSLNC
jgi:3-dehydroquinate dehydratase